MQNNLSKTIYDVKNFWESNPLWAGESQYEPGTEEFLKNIEGLCLKIVSLAGMTKGYFLAKEIGGKFLIWAADQDFGRSNFLRMGVTT